MQRWRQRLIEVVATRDTRTAKSPERHIVASAQATIWHRVVNEMEREIEQLRQDPKRLVDFLGLTPVQARELATEMLVVARERTLAQPG